MHETPSGQGHKETGGCGWRGREGEWESGREMERGREEKKERGERPASRHGQWSRCDQDHCSVSLALCVCHNTCRAARRDCLLESISTLSKETYSSVKRDLRDEIVVLLLGQRVRLGFCEIGAVYTIHTHTHITQTQTHTHITQCRTLPWTARASWIL